MMHLALLTLKISLPGCRSLKEKRQRIGGMHERFGRNPAIAVCESAARDDLESSEWSFVVTGISQREVEAQCSLIEEKVQRCVDGRLHDTSREFL